MSPTTSISPMTPASPMTDADIHAFASPPASGPAGRLGAAAANAGTPAPTVPIAPRRLWPWLLLARVVVLLVAALALSPLWGLALLLWLALSEPRAGPRAAARPARAAPQQA